MTSNNVCTPLKEAANKQYDVIILGSGIGSLASARILSEITDKNILILEQHYALGGNLHSFRRKGKYVFNAGVHYLGIESDFHRSLYDMLTYGSVQWNRLPNRYDHFIFPGFEFLCLIDRCLLRHMIHTKELIITK